MECQLFTIVLESQIENSFIKKLSDNLKYVYREDIHDRATLEQNFREKFQALNRCHLTDNEFARLLEEITESDAETMAANAKKAEIVEKFWGDSRHVDSNIAITSFFIPETE